MGINRVGVLGAGTMGAGIAQVAAQAGLEVLLIDVQESFVERGLSGIAKNLSKAVEKGKLAAGERDAIMGRLSGAVGYDKLKDADLVIEAILENMDLKKKIYSELDTICPPETILASNTSALSITEIATATKRQEKVVGMHFFNPAPVMKLVEVIPGLATSQETLDLIAGVAAQMGKTPIVARESPGFIVNRILVPMINEAAFTFQEGVAPAQDIDTAMKLGANLPIGPLALADMIGIDIVLAVAETFYREFEDPKYRPALILRQMVRGGRLGIKTGRGFYDYSGK
ncbi:MAG TPA: 3-hydroxybutyryl-CoA dehydrogenase [Bacillota bacterium]|nr:3-hydroxybutyryl-CoA dehydrogenase [Bacillota bacterium]